MVENYELCFYWQLYESTEYSKAAINFGKGICLSNTFKITYDRKSKSIKIYPKISSKVLFYSNGISSLTAIVGKNGSGKTTLLNKLRNDLAYRKINNYILVFYCKISRNFVVLDDNNLVDYTKIDNFVYGAQSKKIDSDDYKLKQYLKNISFIYYNNQITSNMYWSESSDNKIDISTEEMIIDKITRIQMQLLNSFYVTSNENYDIINNVKKEDRLKQLSVLSFLIKNNISNQIKITFPKSVKLYFKSLEFQLYRREILIHKLTNVEGYIIENSVNLFKNILDVSGNQYIGYFIFDQYNKIIDEYIKVISTDEYYKQVINMIGKKYTDLNFSINEIDTILHCIKSYIKQIPMDRKCNWKKERNELVDIMIETFCYIKTLIDFSKDIYSEDNQNNLEWYYYFRNSWAKNCKYYVEKCGVRIDGIKEVIQFIQEYKEKFTILNNTGDLEIEFLISNLDKIRRLVHKVRKSDYLFNNILRIEYDINLSSGQDAFYTMFGRLYDIDKEKLEDNIILLLDEPNNMYHPEWEQKFINVMTQLIPKIFKHKKIQVILATHSPIMLSDIPKENVVFLNNNKKMINNKNYISYIDENVDIDNTFGANIYNLYKNAFFLENNSFGIIGDLACKHIERVNSKLDSIINNKKKVKRYEADIKYCEVIINIIGESIIKSALEDKFKLAKTQYQSQKLKNAIKQYDVLSESEQKELISYIINKSNKEHKKYD